MTPTTTQVVCPGCGRGFRLRAEAMVKKVKCNCAAVFVPAEVLAATAVGEDDFVDDAPSARSNDNPLPSAAAPAVRPLSPVAAALAAGDDDVQASGLRDRWFPWLILSVGFIAHLVLWGLWLPSVREVAITASIALTVQTFIFAPLMLGSLMLLAKWFDVGLGDLPTVGWKIVALTLGPAAAADVLFTATLIIANFDWGVVAAGFGFYLVLSGLCAAYIFEIGIAETAFLVTLNFLPRVAACYPAAVLLEDMTWIR